jgi:hypothetical protein
VVLVNPEPHPTKVLNPLPTEVVLWPALTPMKVLSPEVLTAAAPAPVPKKVPEVPSVAAQAAPPVSQSIMGMSLIMLCAAMLFIGCSFA